MATKPLYPQLPKSSPHFKGNGLLQAIKLADRATGASKLASDAYWSFTHPVDRLTGKGRAAHQSMSVPWVATRPWFHGSSRAFDTPDPAAAAAEGMYGPAHYVTDSAKRASDYAMESGNPMTGANVTRYAFEPRRVYDVAGAASKQDVKRVMKGLQRQAREDGQPLWNADLKMMSKDWRGSPRQAIYDQLAGRFGKTFLNAAIRKGGYDAISFQEGAAGGIPRAALAVLNRRRLVRGGQPRRDT